MNLKRRGIGFIPSVLVLLIMIGTVIACGYTERVVQPSEKSFLWFTGNTENAVVYVDNKEFVRLSTPYYVDQTGETKRKPDMTFYQLEPGKHEIRVEKDGKVVVNRVLLLGNQTTKEIMIP